MTITVDVEVLEEMKRKIDRLSKEIKGLKNKEGNGFEKLDTDIYLTEAYN